MTHPFCMILYLYLPTVGTYFMYVRMHLKMSYSPDIDKLSPYPIGLALFLCGLHKIANQQDVGCQLSLDDYARLRNNLDNIIDKLK